MIRQLMSSRRFAPLFWAQFFSALNDNVLKNALVIILLYGTATAAGDSLVTVAGAVFIFPFFILSGLGGELADKYIKSVVARRLKFVEIFAAGFAAAGFFLHSVPLLFVALALFGIIAALFGPVKYSMLPDQLEIGELATGNALVEGATFMAILLGTVAGGQFVAGSANMGWVASAVILLALLSWAFASRIPATTPSTPDLSVTGNPWTSTIGLLKMLYAERRLWDGMVIVSWFWLVGAVVLSLLPALVKDIVGGTEGVVTLCLAIFAIGIAAGSLFAAHLSHVRPNLALVPIGAMVMGIVGLDLAWAIGVATRGHDIAPFDFATSVTGLRMLIDFALFAFGGGLFVVPSFAAVQAWSLPPERARVIAAGNVLQAAFMVVGSLFVALLQAAGLHIGWIFFGLGVASFGGVWFVLTKWGKEGVRDFGALLFRALFLAMNTPMSNRAGTVGRLSPLMEYRLDPVPGIDEGGRLSVRGPNVMLGYLRAENPGVIEPLIDGWHDTGDIVTIDGAGFIAIKGRAKRFAKIAGEMVSLSAIETMAAALWPQAISAAVSIPDQRKGERIVLFTTQKDADRGAMQQQAKTRGASELAVPAVIHVVDKVPVLGTGKIDYVAASAMARELATTAEHELA